MNTICIFEDSGYRNLLPLVWTRGVYELKCGIGSLLEKIVRNYENAEIILYCRDYIQPVLEERYKYSVNKKVNSDICLFINGRILMSEKIPLTDEEEIGIKRKTLVYARIKKENIEFLKPDEFLDDKIVNKLKNKKIKFKEVSFKLIEYPWDLVNNNSDQIKNDFKFFPPQGKIDGEIYEGVHILNKSQIYIGKNSKIKPGVVLDAEDGPIYIGKDVIVESNTVIQGPVFIGDKSIVRPQSIIKEGTSIGEGSRIGGEVSNSIVQSYSNKQHSGFLGHSYIGSWCNLGAGTNTSDLKNNYSTVKVYINGKEINTDSLFVGLIMADHSKSAIGTQFNTGTVVGVSCNIFGQGVIPKYIPSFSWGGAEGFIKYNLDKAIQTAKTVMLRRGKNLSSNEEKLLRDIFNLTQKERVLKSR